MPARIRLQRHGKKGRPFYHIVIADGRAPRDGRFIEKIGTYNPITNPADIKLDFDKAVEWLQNGAQPSDTARAILSFKGVMFKAHLLKGVKKGALTVEQAEARFQEWLKQKQDKLETKIKGLSEKERNERKKLMDAETKVREAKAAEVAKKLAEELQVEVAENEAKAVEETVAQEPAEEVAKAEETKTEEPKAEETEEVKPEKVEEAKAEEPKEEEVKAEKVEEAKAEEPKEEEVEAEKPKTEEPAAETKEDKPEATDESKEEPKS